MAFLPLLNASDVKLSIKVRERFLEKNQNQKLNEKTWKLNKRVFFKARNKIWLNGFPAS